MGFGGKFTPWAFAILLGILEVLAGQANHHLIYGICAAVGTPCLALLIYEIAHTTALVAVAVSILTVCIVVGIVALSQATGPSSSTTSTITRIPPTTRPKLPQTTTTTTTRRHLAKTTRHPTKTTSGPPTTTTTTSPPPALQSVSFTSFCKNEASGNPGCQLQSGEDGAGSGPIDFGGTGYNYIDFNACDNCGGSWPAQYSFSLPNSCSSMTLAMTLGDGGQTPGAGDDITVSLVDAGAAVQSIQLTAWHEIVTQTFALNGQAFTINLTDATGNENFYLISGSLQCTTPSGLAG